MHDSHETYDITPRPTIYIRQIGGEEMNRSRGPSQGLGSLLGAPAIAVLGLVVTSAPAGADVAAGRQAYESGDYGLAMAEWQAAADRKDPEAQFGLGQLYEFGAGDLSQDYHRAAYWYQKAAQQGNVEAEYRLSLIYAAGGDNFSSDLAEAEKWGDLAARSDGVWSEKATAFKKLLDQVTTPDQRADGEKRAAAWIEALAASKPSPQTPRPPGTSEGCPGWPFPTLPCTPQFPPLPGVQRPPAPPSASEQRVQGSPPKATGATSPLAERNAEPAGIDCASLHVRPPICRTLIALNRMKPPGGTGKGELGLQLDDGSTRLREDDPIRLQVRAPNYSVNLRIDYFSLDGSVAHLKPDGGEPPPELAAGKTRLFGDNANSENWPAGGAPFGTELIAAVATPIPLDLGKRPQTEKAADYLRDLKKAFDRIGSSSSNPGLVATLLVETSGR
jgi:hypothetical protein